MDKKTDAIKLQREEQEAKGSAKKPFVKPELKRHEKLPDVTGFSFSPNE